MGLEQCPGTKSGKPLHGMESPDVLDEFERLQGKDFNAIKVALACALAELLDGYVTQIDHKESEGFLFLDKDDVMRWIRFSDLDPTQLFLPYEGVLSVAFNNNVITDNEGTKVLGHLVTCILFDKESGKAYAEEFTDLKQTTAELIAFVKCCVRFRRDIVNG